MGSSAFLKLRGADAQASRAQDNIAGQLQPIATALAKTPIMGAPAPSWIAPSLVQGFANTGGALAVAGFHKDALGYFHGKGNITHAVGTAAGTTVLTLPIGYRPRETQSFPVFGTAATIQFLQVAPNGIVSNHVLIAAGGSFEFAISFLTEQ